MCVSVCVCCHPVIHTRWFFSLLQYLDLAKNSLHIYMCVCVCICKDHRPPHQMIQNHLTPISSGALIVLSNSPLAAWQLSSRPPHTCYHTSHPPLHFPVYSTKTFKMLHKTIDKKYWTAAVARSPILTPSFIDRGLISSNAGPRHMTTPAIRILGIAQRQRCGFK